MTRVRDHKTRFISLPPGYDNDFPHHPSYRLRPHVRDALTTIYSNRAEELQTGGNLSVAAGACQRRQVKPQALQ
jgi:hypothetical protein